MNSILVVIWIQYLYLFLRLLTNWLCWSAEILLNFREQFSFEFSINVPVVYYYLNPVCLFLLLALSDVRYFVLGLTIRSRISDEASGVTSNFGPLQDLKNGPQIPHFPQYGLKMGPLWAYFCLGPCIPRGKYFVAYAVCYPKICF